MAEALRVFISYSHDSDEHRKRVLALSERLRVDGIKTELDQYVNGTPPETWPRWMRKQLKAADRVLLICTQIYYRRFLGEESSDQGKGVDWEGAIVTQEMYDDRSRIVRFIPVLFDPADRPYIPEPARGQSVYCLDSDSGYQALYDALLDQSGFEPGPVGVPKRKLRPQADPLILPDSSAGPTPTGLAAAAADHDDAMDPRGGWIPERDEPLVKVFDHQRQLSVISAFLRDSPADRAIFLFDAEVDDWPSYVADHLCLDLWPDGRGPHREPVQLTLRHYDRQGFWEALLKIAPRAHEATDATARRTLVRDWLRGQGTWVFSVVVELAHCGGQLPEILRGADAALAALGDLGRGTRVLVLFACIRGERRPRFWRALWSRWWVPPFTQGIPLEPLRELERADIERWHHEFPPSRESEYDPGQLKAALMKLFSPSKPVLRYSEVRDFLVGESPGTGALSKARRSSYSMRRYD